MKMEKIEAGACDTGPNENCVLNSAAYSKNAGKKQHPGGVTYQRVSGDLGPIQMLARPGCPPPAVAVERGPTRALVFIEHAPWGWSGGACVCEFLDPASPSIFRYAERLALKLREAALIEQGRRVRQRELAKREREAMLSSRNGGAR